jgi:hypothetical protein
VHASSVLKSQRIYPFQNINYCFLRITLAQEFLAGSLPSKNSALRNLLDSVKVTAGTWQRRVADVAFPHRIANLTQVKWQDHCDRARGYAINLAWCSLDFLKVCSNKHCVARDRGTGRPCTVLNLRELPSVEAVGAAQQRFERFNGHFEVSIPSWLTQEQYDCALAEMPAMLNCSGLRRLLCVECGRRLGGGAAPVSQQNDRFWGLSPPGCPFPW